MDFKKVIEFLLSEFSKSGVDFALVGGLAVSLYTRPRMTQDIDLMVLASDFSKVKEILSKAGYVLEFESLDIATFISPEAKFGRVDMQLAHRKHALNMIKRAIVFEIYSGIKIKVLKPEDIIGLKVQAYSNDPDRYFKDMADIQELMKSEECKDLKQIKEYFNIFSKLDDYDKILNKLGTKK